MEEFFNEMSQYLYLRKEISEKVGSSINVGERFKIKFTLINIAPQVVTVYDRNIRFKKPYLQIVKTDFANPYHPEEGDVYSLGHNFPVTMLEPGQSTSLEMEFTATDTIRGVGGFFPSNAEIATAFVNAHLDTEEYFKIMRSFEFKTSIRPKISLQKIDKVEFSKAEMN